MTTDVRRPIAPRDLFRFRLVSDPQLSVDGSMVAWVQTSILAEANRYHARIHVTDVASGATRALTSWDLSESHPRWSPDGRYIALLATPKTDVPPAAVSVIGRGPQVYVVPAAGGAPVQLTRLLGGARDISWSPDGTRLVMLTYVDPEKGLEDLDAFAVPDDPYEKFNRDVLLSERLHWKHNGIGYFGAYRRHVAVVTFNPRVLDARRGDKTAPVRMLTRGAFDLSAPAWSPDGWTIAAAGNIAPDADNMRKQFIYLVDTEAESPASAPLVVPRELFGLQEMRSTDLAWSPDGKTIAVCGHDSPVMGHYGNQRIWLVDAASGHGRCLTAHIDRTIGDYSRNQDLRGYGGDDGLRWLPDGSALLGLVNEAGTTHIHEFNAETGENRPLTDGDSVIFAFAADTARETIVALRTTDTEPGDLFTFRRSEKRPGPMCRLTRANAEILDEVELAQPQRFHFTSGEATVEGWMIAPPRRKPGERVPILLYTGGGPGGMRAAVFVHEFQCLAAAGYAVVHCNQRGNQGYGEAFSHAVRGHWGDLDYEDNLACLETACDRFEFVDSNRKGVCGGSYGGYMVNWMIARHPDLRAAVSDRCMFNRYSFHGTSDMGYLLDRVEFDGRKPWEDLDTYLFRSPMTHFATVKTPTLVVHSALDHRCHVEQGEQLFMALLRLGVPTEFVRFPDEDHDLSRNGKPWHRVFRLDKYLEWFGKWL
ncbi:MAG: S9 family peptidase [Armatimonadetes bacterium]|nr:S9 family peptidase [Armatimonadota bacterium]